jgi:hypothetical protein
MIFVSIHIKIAYLTSSCKISGHSHGIGMHNQRLVAKTGEQVVEKDVVCPEGAGVICVQSVRRRCRYRNHPRVRFLCGETGKSIYIKKFVRINQSVFLKDHMVEGIGPDLVFTLSHKMPSHMTQQMQSQSNVPKLVFHAEFKECADRYLNLLLFFKIVPHMRL